MDLLPVWFMKRFLPKPMHVFGFWGLLARTAGGLMGSVLVIQKLLGADIGSRPLLTLCVLLLLTGVQLFCFGLLAEVMMRTYHESQNRPIYRIRATLRGNETLASSVTAVAS